MAWVTVLGPSMAQVDYRLKEGAGCAHPDQQVAYRLADERGLVWIGEGLREVGIVPGSALTAEQHPAARALMDGCHPGTGEVLVVAKKAVDPRALLAGAPLLEALERAAAARGLGGVAALYAGNAALASRAGRLERGVRRKGEAYSLPYEAARKLAATADVNLAALYPADRLAEARRWRNARVRVGNRGYDLTLDVSKSVSVLYGLSTPEVSAVVENTFAEAVAETVAAVEGWVAYGQRGHQGDGRLAARVPASGLLGWVVWHRTARPVDGQAPDPHLHAHVPIANLVRGADGRWSAVAAGGRDLHRHVHAADALLKARLRRGLIERFGVVWERDAVTGAWEIVGIDERLRARFSKRDGQVKAVLAKHGITYESAHPHARRVASTTSRQAKHQAADGDLVADWHAQCAADGVDAAAVLARCLHRDEGLPRRPDAADIAAWIWRPDGGLTAHAKTVTRADVLAAVADACPDGVADLADLETLTDEILTFGPAVRLPDGGAAHLVNATRYTSADVLAAERQILALTRARYEGGVAVVDAAAAALAIGAVEAGQGFAFTAGQRQVLERLLGGGHGVEAVLGVPGAGKTILMAAARAGWESRGLVVAGAATAAVAAANLTAESGIPARTIAAWLAAINDAARPGLNGVDVLVIDEAAMVDDRHLAALLAETHRTGTKVVALGDPLQLRAVGVGGGFAAIHRQVDGPTLKENRRQADPVERRALELWRAGERREALRTWGVGGRVHAGADATDTLAALLADWRGARAPYAADVHDELAAVLVLAGTNDAADRLNMAARALRRHAGELSGPDRLYRLAGGRTLALAVGDHVRIRVNDYRAQASGGARADVLNGYRGVITAIHADRSVDVRWRAQSADGPALVVERLDAAYISAGGLSHGTALTVAAAQGLTSDHALVYGLGLDPHTLYAAMTRDRLSARLYLPRTVLESDADRARLGEPRSPDEELHRALDAYAATVQGDRADRLISPEPEPIAATRAREREAAEQADLQAKASAAFAAAMLEQVTDPRRPHGMLSDADLAARIAAVAARVAELAPPAKEQRQRTQAHAEQAAAIRRQAHADLTGERDCLAEALAALEEAGRCRQAAHAEVGTAEQRVIALERRLREQYGGWLRGRLPSAERSRLDDRLRQANDKLARGRHRAEAAGRAEQAALHAALEVVPAAATVDDLHRRLRILTGPSSFAAAVQAESAARLEQLQPGAAVQRRVQAARATSSGVGEDPIDRHHRARQALAALEAEAAHRRRLDAATRRGEETARRHPAAATRAETRREQDQTRGQRAPGAYRPLAPGISLPASGQRRSL
ncbi:MobF family relaxase [Streptosporangium nondiastaticum]|uniref:MobF family relaxase n=3 Tax=Streptosporangium nondiastaticum TaxID=35764 RepID=UPI0035E77B9C